MGSGLLGHIYLDQFRVDRFVASGGMATVYRVYDLKRSVSLAMKVLQADLAEDPVIFNRFQREADALTRLAHPHIVPFYGLYQTEDFAFLLERYIDGPTLKDILKARQGQPMPVSEVLTYMKAVCSALGYAHANNLVHCDIKPGNVMVDHGGIVYLADFGIARYSDSSSTSTLAGAGTPAYMAPEQILGANVSAATDIYALGVMLFELFTGRRPFTGTEAGLESTGNTTGERVRYAHLKLPPPDPRSLNLALSPALGQVILKAMEKEAAKRFNSTQAFFEALCAAAGLTPDQIAERLELRDLAAAPATGGTGTKTKSVGAAASSPAGASASGNTAGGNILAGGYTADTFAGETLAAPVGSGRGAAPAQNQAKKGLPGWAWVAGAGCLLVIIVVAVGGLAWAGGASLLNPQPTAVLSAQDTPASPDAQAQANAAATATLVALVPEDGGATLASAPADAAPQGTGMTKTPPLLTVKTSLPLRPLMKTVTPTGPASCPGAKAQRVKAGGKALVCTRSDNLIVRKDPALSAAEIRRIPTGSLIEIVSGPQCADASSWWFIKSKDGTTGWVREGSDEIDPYFICPAE